VQNNTKTQFDQYTVCNIFVLDAKQALQLVLGTTAQGNVCKMYFLRSTHVSVEPLPSAIISMAVFCLHVRIYQNFKD
jgi:hypothetical protein